MVGFLSRRTLLAAAFAHAQPKLKLADIRVRDPFILADRKTYYLYAQMGNRLPNEDPRRGVEVYRSQDLENWEAPTPVLELPADFWARHAVWAPEVHRYRGRYYLFVTFTGDPLGGDSPKGLPPMLQRGTQILHADSPTGPFKPFANRAHTPAKWMALDGTLFVERGRPYMVFCHEWLQIDDGTVELMPLKKDLSAPDGDPVTLFKATDATWGRGLRTTEGRRHGWVTDGPFLHRTKSGKLLMIWSSFGDEAYTLAVAESAGGKIAGPWRLQPEPIFRKDGGHGMIFRTFGGELMLTLHQPNKGQLERAKLFRLSDEGDMLKLNP
jgi:beta-xylosidase